MASRLIFLFSLVVVAAAATPASVGGGGTAPRTCEVTADGTLASCAGFDGDELDLSSSGITALAPRAFAGLRGLRGLRELNCGYNNLREVPRDAFAGLGELRSLRLHVTALRTLPGGVFEPLARLRVLVLSFGALETLPPGIFDALGELEVLDLSFNALSALPDRVFGRLARLQRLWLQGNRLAAVPDVSGMPALAQLFLFDNPLPGALCDDGAPGCAHCPLGYDAPVSVNAAGAPVCLPSPYGPARTASCTGGNSASGVRCVETSCRPGTFAARPGAGGCEECPPGHSCVGGGGAPVPCGCDSGYFSGARASVSCVGATASCLACPVGHTCDGGSAQPLPCASCAAGEALARREVAAPGACGGVCDLCPMGFACVGGLAPPAPCSCAPGYFSGATGARDCAGVGGTCARCAARSGCAGGAEQPVVCAPGMAQSAAGTHCEPCGYGTHGAVVDGAAAAGGCIECPYGGRCLDGNACAAGATGDLCDACRVGFYSDHGGACSRCPSHLLRAVVALAVLFVLCAGAAGGSGVQAAVYVFVQGVQLLQILVLVVSFDAPWGPISRRVRAHAALVGLLGLDSLACVTSSSSDASPATAGALVVAAIAAACLLCACRQRLWRGVDRVCSTAGVLLTIPVLHVCVGIISCVRGPSGGTMDLGSRVLASDASVTCDVSNPAFLSLLLIVYGLLAVALLLLPSDVRHGMCGGDVAVAAAALPSALLKAGNARFDLWSLRCRCLLVLLGGAPAGWGVLQGAAGLLLGLGYGRVVSQVRPYVAVLVPWIRVSPHDAEVASSILWAALSALCVVLPSVPVTAVRNVLSDLVVGTCGVATGCVMVVCAAAVAYAAVVREAPGGGATRDEAVSFDVNIGGEPPRARGAGDHATGLRGWRAAAAAAAAARAPPRRWMLLIGASLVAVVVVVQWYAAFLAAPPDVQGRLPASAVVGGPQARRGMRAGNAAVAEGEEEGSALLLRSGARALVSTTAAAPRAISLAERPVVHARSIPDRHAGGFSRRQVAGGGVLDVIAITTELVVWRRQNPQLAPLVALFDACSFHKCELPPLRVPAPLPVVHDFERWQQSWQRVREGSYEFKRFEPMDPPSMPLPVTSDDVPRVLQQHLWSQTAPASVAVFNDVCVSGIGHVFIDDVAFSPLRGCEHSEEPKRYYDPQTVYDEAVSIGQWWFENYYHFFMEALGRLALIAPYLRANPHVQVLATTLTDQPFTLGLLEFIGISRDRVHLAACARRLLLPEPMSCGRPSMTHLLALRSEVLRGLGNVPPAPPEFDVLLIHRSQKRRMTNFWELYGALCALGRVGLFHGGLSAKEGFAMWGKSRMVVADHGAGLSNMVAAHAPFTVIEFQTLRIHRRAYERMATMLGFRHIAFSPEGATDENGGVVDIAAVVQAVAGELGVDPAAPPVMSPHDCAAAVASAQARLET